jgi:hypothetical protein
MREYSNKNTRRIAARSWLRSYRVVLIPGWVLTTVQQEVSSTTRYSKYDVTEEVQK